MDKKKNLSSLHLQGLVLSTVALFLFKQQHGELRACSEAVQGALHAPLVDIFTKTRVARLVAVFLMQGRLHCSENMEARVFDEHVIYIQVLQDVLVLLDVR